MTGARPVDPGPVPVHPIEVESYRILGERVDLSDREPLARAMIERMIHATADLSFAETARVGARAGAALLDALLAGAPVIVDAAMVAAGITRYPTECYLPRVPVAPEGSTRSAAAFRLAAEEHPSGAVFVCGNAPTALFEVLDLHAAGLVDPAAVVGLPVGFVGAAESKAALWASALAPVSVTNVGERGGSPPAAGAVNAIVRAVAERRETAT
ncbi:MAG: precorrin-8X methylmutase [Actinomycetota bacterium]